MLVDAHYHALSVMGGIPECGIYDNMKMAVDKVVHGKEHVINKQFQAMADIFALVLLYDEQLIEQVVDQSLAAS